MPRNAYEVMDLKSLRCFFAVARHGSLTKAGIELGISEAAVSQRVRSLEAYLGAKLYEARGGRVQLSAAGERTARLAVSVFGEIEALESAVGDAQETAEIALASHDSALRYLLPDKVEAFCRAHPLARLRLIARPVEETLRLVRANECDLGVVPERPIPEELSFRAVTTYPTCMVLQKGHPLARRGKADFGALVGDGMTGRYPLILLEVQREDQRLQQAFERHRVPFNVALEVSTIDTLKHYVARGLGIGFISAFCITSEDRARLEVLPIPAEFGGDNTYGVVVRRDKHRTNLLKNLLTILATFDAVAGPAREATAEKFRAG
jgi:DNA-binding transcriptional LysR family regulator